MNGARWTVTALTLLALVTLLAQTGCEATALGENSWQADGIAPVVSENGATSPLQVTLVAPRTTTSWDAREPNPARFNLPLLYLNREGLAAPEAERTLEIQLAGLVDSTALRFEAVSFHADVTTGEPHRMIQQFVTPERPCTSETPCTVRWTQDPSTMHSDIYYLTIQDLAGHTLWHNPVPGRPDFVALDTWDVEIGQYIARVTYATLFPFARGENDLASRLRPAEVADFVEHRFLPLISDTWRVQAEGWGFGDPIHPEWDGDGLLEVFVTTPPFALFGGTGTYTISLDSQGKPYPERRIWWFSSNTAFQAYDTLENAYRAVFAHEFFHTMQWNVILNSGCSPHKWNNVFIEAQGKFAPSVQYPELELLRTHLESVRSEYSGAAQRYLDQRLNDSYRDMEADLTNKYDAALYWRFLYEQYGDMDIVRAALEEMACGYQTNIEAGLAPVMNATFARFDGPFRDFEDSLIAFARANYALRLAHGRCVSTGSGVCGDEYRDPHLMYADPPLEAELTYAGSALTYDDAIPNGYGIDLIEVQLDPRLHTQPLTVTFQSDGARFNVEVWKLAGGTTLLSRLADDSIKLQACTTAPETMLPVGEDLFVTSIPQLDVEKFDHLALIITRLDADQVGGRSGNYRILLQTTMQDEASALQTDPATELRSAAGDDVSAISQTDDALPFTP
jgi:hypothetical protein